jgi:P-type Ca2+ transporter type 2C
LDYYKINEIDAINHLKSKKSGLTKASVQHKQEKYGKNIIQIQHENSFLKLIILQFKNYLIWLLIIIASFAFIAGYFFNNFEQIIDGIIISFIIIFNILLSAYQDYKGEKSAQVLKSMLKNEALIIRNNIKSKINSEELVPGDIIFLKEGDKIPADCKIISCKDFKINESMLTGESKNINKNSLVILETVPLAKRKNMIYMNTFVVNGTAECLVVATGKNTEVGKIAQSINMEQKYPFNEEIDFASKKITYVAIVMIMIVLTVFFIKGYTWISIFMIGTALIIGAIPEGLPAIVTFSLALGSLKLVKNNVLVKRKSLLETLGSVDVVCTDKTGTLTENQMTVKKLFFDMHTLESIKKISSNSLFQFKNCGILCNEAKNTDKGFVGVSEDIALIDYFNDIDTDILEIQNKNPTSNFEPFSSEKKYVYSENMVDNKLVSYRKGAPGMILDYCKYYIKNGVISKLTKEDRKKIFDALKKSSDDSLRNIAFSYKPIKNKNSKNGSEIFIGFVGIYDAPKEGINKTINLLLKAGIELKMITGDNIHTACAIAKECGFKNIKGITWDEIKDLSENDLKIKVEECNVFARMSPEFKLKIVYALQLNGKRVAITGDGVNDVPALKKADVGISMGDKGADIAKEASDIILLDDDLSSIVKSIKEGRTVFSNVRKVINYLLTANLAEVLVIFIGSFFGLMPFLAIQLLWVNFVTDILPAMAFAMDPPHDNIMTKKPTGKNEKLINKRITLLTIFVGLKKVIIMFGLFYATYKLTNNLELAQTMSFTWLVFSHFVRIAAIRFDEKVPLFVNKFLNWAIIIPVIFQVIIIYTPLSKFFHTVPLNLFHWIIIITTSSLGIGLAKIITTTIDNHLPVSELDY